MIRFKSKTLFPLTFVFCLLALKAGAGDWPAYKNASARLSSSTSEALFPQLQPKWSADSDYLEAAVRYSSPVIFGGFSYIASITGTLYAFENGAQLVSGKNQPAWKFKTDSAIYGSAAVGLVGITTRVYIGSTDGKLYCLDAIKGDLIWKASLKGGIFSSPLLISVGPSQIVLCGSNNGSLHALNATDGTSLWEYQTDGIIFSSPLFDGSKIFIPSYDGKLYALNDQGIHQWDKPVGPTKSTPALAGGVIFNLSNDGTLSSFKADGTTAFSNINTSSPGPHSSSPVATRGSSSTTLVWCLESGEVISKEFHDSGSVTDLWTRALPDGIYSTPAIANGVVYLGCNDGKVYGLDLVNGGNTLQTIDLTAPARVSPAVADNTLFVSSSAGIFQAYGMSVAKYRLVGPTDAFLTEKVRYRLEALDVNDNPIPTYSGLADLSASGGAIDHLPSNPIQFQNGIAEVEVQFQSSGTVVLQVDEAGGAGIIGNLSVNVSPITPTPAPATLTPTPTTTMTSTKTLTPTFTPTESKTWTSTPTVSPTPTITVTFSPTPTWTLIPGAIIYRVNCGGPQFTSAANAKVWVADRAYGSGPFGYTVSQSTQVNNTSAISGTPDQGLYQRYRYREDFLEYAFNVPDGVYQVTLKWALPSASSNFQPLDVSAENNLIYGSLDLAALAGVNVAFDKTFLVYVDDGFLNISFESEARAFISAIEVVQVGILGTPTPTHTSTSCPPNAIPGFSWGPRMGMPEGRAAFGVGTSDGNLYVIGGWNGPTLNTVIAYNPTSNSWINRANMPTGRYGFGVAEAGGLLYAIGGFSGTNRNTVEAYNPATNSWIGRNGMPQARSGVGVGVLNGIIYAVGGWASGARNETFAYNPSTNNWTNRASMVNPRFDLAVGVVNGVLYAVGGQTTSNNALATVEAYNPSSNSWSPRSSMNTPRTDFSVVVLGGIMYAIGGHNGSTFLNSIEAYDPVLNTWTLLPVGSYLPTARAGLSVGVVDGMLYAVGGVNSDGEALEVNEWGFPICIPPTPTMTPQACVINQNSIAGNFISIEAEKFDMSISRGNQQWEFIAAPTNFSGNGAMQALPDFGTSYPNATGATGFVAAAPRLDYRINFPQSGTYYIWIRGNAPSDSSDTLHIGLNGNPVGTSDDLEIPDSNSWQWTRGSQGFGGLPRLTVPAGLQTLNMWMRNDGVKVDKIILTLDSGFNPNSFGPLGPPETARCANTHTPTGTSTPTQTMSSTASRTATQTPTASQTPTPTVTSTPSMTPTATLTSTPPSAPVFQLTKTANPPSGHYRGQTFDYTLNYERTNPALPDFILKDTLPQNLELVAIGPLVRSGGLPSVSPSISENSSTGEKTVQWNMDGSSQSETGSVVLTVKASNDYFADNFTSGPLFDPPAQTNFGKWDSSNPERYYISRGIHMPTTSLFHHNNHLVAEAADSPIMTKAPLVSTESMARRLILSNRIRLSGGNSGQIENFSTNFGSILRLFVDTPNGNVQLFINDNLVQQTQSLIPIDTDLELRTEIDLVLRRIQFTLTPSGSSTPILQYSTPSGQNDVPSFVNKFSDYGSIELSFKSNEGLIFVDDVLITPDNFGDLMNQSILEYPAGTTVSTASTTHPAVAGPNIEILKAATPVASTPREEYTIGDQVTYNLTVNNTGGIDLHNVVVQDTLSNQMMLLTNPNGASVMPSVSGSVLSWDLGPLPVGASIPLQYSAQVAPTQPYPNLVNLEAFDQYQSFDGVDPVIQNWTLETGLVGVPASDLVQLVDDGAGNKFIRGFTPPLDGPNPGFYTFRMIEKILAGDDIARLTWDIKPLDPGNGFELQITSFASIIRLSWNGSAFFFDYQNPATNNVFYGFTPQTSVPITAGEEYHVELIYNRPERSVAIWVYDSLNKPLAGVPFVATDALSGNQVAMQLNVTNFNVAPGTPLFELDNFRIEKADILNHASVTSDETSLVRNSQPGVFARIAYAPTPIPSATPTSSSTSTATPTLTSTETLTETSTPTSTETTTETPTSTVTSTDTPTVGSEPTFTPTSTLTFTTTPTETWSGGPYATYTVTSTETWDGGEYETYTPTVPHEPTPTSSSTGTATETPDMTSTPSTTATSTPTVPHEPTPTPTPTTTATYTPSWTATWTPSPTTTFTKTPSFTPSSTKTRTATKTPTNTPTPMPSNTPTPRCGEGVVSSPKLNLQVSCFQKDSQQERFHVRIVNWDSSPVTLGNLQVKMWVNESGLVNMQQWVQLGQLCRADGTGCVNVANTGFTATGSFLGTTCVADPTHKANQAVVFSTNGNSQVIPPNGGTWANGFDLGIGRNNNFMDDAFADDYSKTETCPGGWVDDIHFGLYYNGQLVREWTNPTTLDPNSGREPCCGQGGGSIGVAMVRPMPSPTDGPSNELLERVRVEPNISYGDAPVQFKIECERGAFIKLALFTISGELAYSTTLNGVAGLNTIVWKGRNSGGANVASGLYLYHLSVGDPQKPYSRTGKLIVLR